MTVADLIECLGGLDPAAEVRIAALDAKKAEGSLAIRSAVYIVDTARFCIVAER